MSILLTRDAESSVLMAYLESKHPALMPLLPPDTTPEDLFGRVGRSFLGLGAEGGLGLTVGGL